MREPGEFHRKFSTTFRKNCMFIDSEGTATPARRICSFRSGNLQSPIIFRNLFPAPHRLFHRMTARPIPAERYRRPASAAVALVLLLAMAMAAVYIAPGPENNNHTFSENIINKTDGS